MWTLICLTPAALLFAHQVKKGRARQAIPGPTMADIPVIVLVGNDLEVDL